MATELGLLLELGDVDQVRAWWAARVPGFEQKQTREQTEALMHRARTESEAISLRARAYSHAWLMERGLPSGLPDELRASAERMYPVVALAVGISVNTRNPLLRPAMEEVRGAMEHAVMDAHADGRLADTPFVRARMDEARAKTLHALFGR